MATATAPTTDAGEESTAPQVDPRVPWRPGTAGLAARLLVFLGLFALVMAIPHLLPAPVINVAIKGVVYAMVALSMNILMGYVGQVSLGHQAFVGVGAFAAGFLITEAGLPWGFAVAGAVVVGGLQSLILGSIALRIRGFYFAIVTIAYGLFAQEVIFNIRAITRGGAGMPADRPAFAFNDIPYFYLCLALLLLVWLFDWRLTASKAGRAIQGLRDDQRVAASWGINVKAYTLLAFVISGSIAGLAGALLGSIEQIVVSVTFSLTLAIIFVVMTVVGGLRSRPGVVIGGIVFAALPTVLAFAHDTPGWGVPGETAAGVLPACGTAPPRVIQLVIGLALIGGALEMLHHVLPQARPVAVKIGAVVGGAALAALGVYVGLGGFIGGYCLWSGLTPTYEPLIGAGLLLVTLIKFPGGIAEQLAPLIRWLSFKPLHASDDGAVAGGPGGGAH